MIDVFLGHYRDTISFLRGGTSYLDFAKIALGGAGNVASALSLLGGRVAFIGKSGDDSFGRFYEEDLKAKGVTTQIFLEDGVSTGLALIDLDRNGERSFHVFRGANDRLSDKEIDRSVGLFKKSEYAYFCGYSLVANPQKDAILRALNLAKKNGVKVFFDPGAYNLIDANCELFNELFHSCDVFCPNLDEAKATFKTHYLKAVIQELRKANKFTALKCGARGCVLISEAECTRVPGFKVNCVDTTGAGDAFAAGLIYGIVKGLPLFSTGRLANWLAAKVATRVGARSFPSGNEIRSFLKELRNKRK